MMAGVQLHQLEYLVAVVDEGGFTRAAEHLRVAQPGVSAQVRKLERELGHTLLDRSGHQVRPTPVGVEVVAAARAALDAVAGVRRVVDDLDGLLRGTARAGMVSSGPFLDVPGVLADFSAAHPHVVCSLVEQGTGALLEGLRGGRLDVALVGAAGPLPDDLEVRTVSEQPLVLAVPPDHPLAGLSSAGPADLVGHDLVLPAEGNALREAVDLRVRLGLAGAARDVQRERPVGAGPAGGAGAGRGGAAGVGVGAAHRGAGDGAVLGSRGSARDSCWPGRAAMRARRRWPCGRRCSTRCRAESRDQSDRVLDRRRARPPPRSRSRERHAQDAGRRAHEVAIFLAIGASNTVRPLAAPSTITVIAS